MVIFDQLRVGSDGNLYINVHVNGADYFDDVYLDTITIMTADKVSENDPSTPTSDYIYTQTFDDDLKSADLVLSATDFTKTWETEATSMTFSTSEMFSTLFFVYVTVKGTPDECTPCELDNATTLGVTFDETRFYQKVMQFTRELANTCTIPKGFIDLILLWNGFKAAIETEHFVPAIDFWNKMFAGTSGSTYSTTNICGCHG